MEQYRSYLGSGKIYLQDVSTSTPGALKYIGNVSKLDLAIAETKLEQRDYSQPGGGINRSVSRVQNVSLALTADSIHEENLAVALFGKVDATAAGTVTAEAHSGVTPGALVPLAHVGAKSVTVTSTSGMTTYVEGVDYEVTGAGILSKTITGGIEVAYSYPKQSAVHSLVDVQRVYRVIFDGLNEAEGGSPVVVTVNRVKFSPAANISLIADSFGSLDLNGEVLKHDGAGFGTSKYFNVQYTELA